MMGNLRNNRWRLPSRLPVASQGLCAFCVHRWWDIVDEPSRICMAQQPVSAGKFMVSCGFFSPRDFEPNRHLQWRMVDQTMWELRLDGERFALVYPHPLAAPHGAYVAKVSGGKSVRMGSIDAAGRQAVYWALRSAP